MTTMHTTLEWWQAVKGDDKLLNDWLIRQYRGEVTAARRIEMFRDRYARDAEPKRVLTLIAAQEEKHAEWVLGLLQARGIEASVTGAEERYWKETLPAIEDFETGAAVGAHAEEMRLARIRVICDDDTAPADIRAVFQKILREEEFHARAFKKLAGKPAYFRTQGAHEKGMALLGLVA